MNKTAFFAKKTMPLVGFFLMLSGHAAFADNAHYKFEEIGQPVVASGKDTVKVKLVDTTNSKTVSDAIISESKVFMGPLDAPAMTAPVTASPGENGIFKITINPSMAGDWSLHLVAKIPGQPEAVSGTLVVKLAG